MFLFTAGTLFTLFGLLARGIRRRSRVVMALAIVLVPASALSDYDALDGGQARLSATIDVLGVIIAVLLASVYVRELLRRTNALHSGQYRK